MVNKNYNIDEIKQLMPDYVMDRLSTDEKNKVEKALEIFPELKSLYDDISGTIGFVETVKSKEPEPQYWSSLLPRIHERIEHAEVKRFSWDRLASYWKIAVPAAAIILIAIIYFTLISKKPEPAITEEKKELNTDSVKQNINNDEQKKDIVKENRENEKRENEIRVKHHRKLTIDENLFSKKNIEHEEEKEIEQVETELAVENDEDIFRSTGRVFDPISEESAIIGSAGRFDDETEEQLNRLSDNEQEILITELKNSNL